MKHSFALGIDFGTNSARALLLEVNTGEEISSSVCTYPSGDRGVLLHSDEPHLARQHPGDYLIAMQETVSNVLQEARAERINPENILGIGVDTTGSTPLPVDKNVTPLGVIKEFAHNPNAQAWLWKDHTASEEARQITELAQKIRPQFLAKCGGAYSSEWFFAKILHCLRTDPAVFETAYTWLELSDYIPAALAGIEQTDRVKRNLCAAGHKAMYNKAWGGLPDADFFKELDPRLATLRDRLYVEAHPSNEIAGYLCQKWSEALGLPRGIPVAVGALDAHLGAVGSGIEEGVLVKIMGTSTCDIMVHPKEKALQDIPGVAGIADDSVLPGYVGIEAGQSAVGDIFNWFVSRILDEK
ncbi:MAG: ribulokinase, partial [Caldithrix sp.]|nr:ribulokinase [Caldithrix sp.]